jgi:hypothetical protein
MKLVAATWIAALVGALAGRTLAQMSPATGHTATIATVGSAR